MTHWNRNSIAKPFADEKCRAEWPRRKRPCLGREWCIAVVRNPIGVERQEDNRRLNSGVMQPYWHGRPT